MRLTFSILLISVTVLYSFAQRPNRTERKMAKRIQGHIEYLASDELTGRGTGTKGEQLSAKYIAEEFENMGLIPKGEEGYFQNLDITTLRIAQSATALMIGKEAYTLFMDFYPLSSSSNNARYSGVAVNIKNGISDLHLSWNDYENIDVNGKAVLIKMEVPDADNPHSKFAAWGGVERRVELAKKNGAKAIVFYSNNKENYPNGELKKMAQDLEVPIMFIQRDLDSMISPTVDMNVDILSVQQDASNVIGFIDHGAENTVVVGAHHDHLGHGENGGSRAEKIGDIHNGADDNASGVAGLFELARLVKKYPKDFKNNNYLFIAFTAEELGLVGSKYFVKNPTIPLSSINYMINMDMIGKLDSIKKTLVINGIGTSPAWKVALEESERNNKKIAAIKTTESGIGSSDHTAFYLADIPSVHFFTGQHTHYHKPSDDPDIVNYSGEAYVLMYICEWMENMDEQGKVEFTKTKDQTQGRMRFKVTLGIMPDYIYDGEGLRVDGVKDGKPGALAGLEKGDVITSMNGKTILNIQDYMKLLTELNPGDKVPVQVKRGDEFIELEVQF